MLLVPYDGSRLARAAVERAREVAELRDEAVLALTVLPDDAAFARERGWIDEDEAYDPDAVAARFEREVAERAPDATFRVEQPDEGGMLASSTMDVARRIRQVAREVDARVVFIGSENAGRVSTPVTSVGSPVSRDPRYDVYIVRHA
jgi:nucleotide-binding universal stress UspA family protein